MQIAESGKGKWITYLHTIICKPITRKTPWMVPFNSPSVLFWHKSFKHFNKWAWKGHSFSSRISQPRLSAKKRGKGDSTLIIKLLTPKSFPLAWVYTFPHQSICIRTSGFINLYLNLATWKSGLQKWLDCFSGWGWSFFFYICFLIVGEFVCWLYLFNPGAGHRRH